MPLFAVHGGKFMVELRKITDSIPYNPGIYLMKDKDDKIIYVGKAKSLKKRVKQYFNKSTKTIRIQKMVEQITNVDYIVTRNEVEALILECNYIKENMPKYNIMLKDDKTYPYIKITTKDNYPIIYSTRSKINDGNTYLGPYANVTSMNNIIKMIKEIFPIKRCKYNLNKSSNRNVGPCLYYHINRCLGPCINDIKQSKYKEMINQIILFLQGKTKELEENIKNIIEEHITKLEFEKANELKKILESINNINRKQSVENINIIDTDIWGYIIRDAKLYIQIFKIRSSKISTHDNFVIENFITDTIEEDILNLMSQYYLKDKNIPKEIYIKLRETEKIKQELMLIEKGLIETVKETVKIKIPKKGRKLNFIKMAENNILIKLNKKEENILEQLKQILNIEKDINIIEAYDISNLKNDNIVGTYITYEDGKLNKTKYRKFNIKSTKTQNDVLSMSEIIKRRISHIKEWGEPDLMLIDGGINQVNAVKKILHEADIDIAVIGMIKDDKHRTMGIIDLNGNKKELTNKKKYKEILRFLTFIQDEVHRFTITYHRKLRDRIKKHEQS